MAQHTSNVQGRRVRVPLKRGLESTELIVVLGHGWWWLVGHQFQTLNVRRRCDLIPYGEFDGKRLFPVWE